MKKATATILAVLLAGCSPRLQTEPLNLSATDRIEIEGALRLFGVTNNMQIVAGEQQIKGRNVFYRIIVRNLDEPDLAEAPVYELIKSNQAWVVTEESGGVIF